MKAHSGLFLTVWLNACWICSICTNYEFDFYIKILSAVLRMNKILLISQEKEQILVQAYFNESC